MVVNTLLVVDDSRLSRMMVKALAKAHQPDWHIIEACDGEEALSLGSDQGITHMTIDYNMPGIDGLTLALKLKERYPSAKIGLLTANIQQHLIDDAAAANICFISKPISEKKICSFVTTQ